MDDQKYGIHFRCLSLRASKQFFFEMSDTNEQAAVSALVSVANCKFRAAIAGPRALTCGRCKRKTTFLNVCCCFVATIKTNKQEVEFNHIKQQQVEVVIHCDTQTPLLSYMKRCLQTTSNETIQPQ
jgi:hypothetical protein